MKKLLLGALLLLSTVSFSQIPSYLTDNEIQFTIEPTTGKWYKRVKSDKTVHYIYTIELRNENYITFMNECNRVLTYYGVDNPVYTNNEDKNQLYYNYDKSKKYPSFYQDNVRSYQNFSVDDIRMIVYAYLVRDRKKFEVYEAVNDDISISVTENFFMLVIEKRKK